MYVMLYRDGGGIPAQSNGNLFTVGPYAVLLGLLGETQLVPSRENSCSGGRKHEDASSFSTC